MNVQEASNCNEMLIDLVCYEVQLRRLSPEMERLFNEHLRQCPVCRGRVTSFQRMVVEACRQRNFG